jgi:hypothetical protein
MGKILHEVLRGWVGLAGLFVAAVACSETPFPSNTRTHGPGGSEDAVRVVLDVWNVRMFNAGLPVITDAPLSEFAPHVEWYAGTCLDYGDFVPPGCYAGAYWPGDDRIDLIFAARPSDTSLAHETLHFALGFTTGDDDPSHDSVLWDQVHEVNGGLSASGW